MVIYKLYVDKQIRIAIKQICQAVLIKCFNVTLIVLLIF
jgi:hypothetical protein